MQRCIGSFVIFGSNNHAGDFFFFSPLHILATAIRGGFLHFTKWHYFTMKKYIQYI